MKKKIIIGSLIAVGLVLLVLLCVLLLKPNTNIETPSTDPALPTETLPDAEIIYPNIEIPGPENPEEFLHESFDLAKKALGDEYYPNVAINSIEISEMLGLEPTDCLLAFAQISDDETRPDMIIAIQAIDEQAMGRINDALHKYATKLKENTSYPEYIRIALNSYLTGTDVHDYVFLVTTFGDLSSVADKSEAEIMALAEKNALKVMNAILLRNNGELEETNPDKD